MDVYLVPVGPDRHELYCEVPDEPEGDDGDEPPRGSLRRLRAYFSTMLAEAERERREERAHGDARSQPAGWVARFKARSMRWVAESIAEQRLLWHLRRETTACLFYPDDIDEARATTVLRTQLQRDFDKHRFWLTIQALFFVASGIFFFIPGPNVIAYYFAFRLVGHYLSMRGASNGLSGITWTAERSEPLAELRRAIALEPAAREERVQDVAGKLQLEHLATFFARTALAQDQPPTAKRQPPTAA
jgi:hypothetical protein